MIDKEEITFEHHGDNSNIISINTRWKYLNWRDSWERNYVIIVPFCHKQVKQQGNLLSNELPISNHAQSFALWCMLYYLHQQYEYSLILPSSVLREISFHWWTKITMKKYHIFRCLYSPLWVKKALLSTILI